MKTKQKRAVILRVQSTPASKLYREQIGLAKFEVEKLSNIQEPTLVKSQCFHLGTSCLRDLN